MRLQAQLVAAGSRGRLSGSRHRPSARRGCSQTRRDRHRLLPSFHRLWTVLWRAACRPRAGGHRTPASSGGGLRFVESRAGRQPSHLLQSVELLTDEARCTNCGRILPLRLQPSEHRRPSRRRCTVFAFSAIPPLYPCRRCRGIGSSGEWGRTPYSAPRSPKNCCAVRRRGPWERLDRARRAAGDAPTGAATAPHRSASWPALRAVHTIPLSLSSLQALKGLNKGYEGGEGVLSPCASARLRSALRDSSSTPSGLSGEGC